MSEFMELLKASLSDVPEEMQTPAEDLRDVVDALSSDLREVTANLAYLFLGQRWSTKPTEPGIVFSIHLGVVVDSVQKGEKPVVRPIELFELALPRRDTHFV